MKYFLYVRKSTEQEERQALSIQSQLGKCREMFSHLQVTELEPESASAFIPGKRPIFENMMERLDKGEADGIIAWHPDRLSRNEIEAAAITYRVRTGKILDLKFGSYTFDNSAEGIMMLQMTMSQSQYSSAKLSKEVKRGNEKKISLGWKPGWAPTGYVNTPDREKGTKIILPDPVLFRPIQLLFERYLTGGYSVPEVLEYGTKMLSIITRKTKHTGGKPLSRSALYGMFSNPFYAGQIRYNGELHKGSQKPMITISEFDRVQTLLGKKGRPRPKRHDITFRGNILCGECGFSITAEVKTKYIKSTGETKQYTYYHCTHKKPCSQKGSITEKVLENEINTYLSKITILPEFRDWALKVIRENNDSEIDDRMAQYKAKEKLYVSTQHQLDELTKMRVRELINDEEYASQKEILTKEKDRLREFLDDNANRADKWLELTEEVFDFATTARDKFNEGNPQTKRSIFYSLGQNFTILDGKLEFDPNKWFVPIEKNYASIEAEYNEVRTNAKTTSKVKEAAIASINATWLRVAMDVRTACLHS